MPGGSAIHHHFGSFRAACDAAYGASRGQGGRWATKDTDTEAVLLAVYVYGRSLADVGRERGVSGQALGRRVRRYLRAHGLTMPTPKQGPRRRALSVDG